MLSAESVIKKLLRRLKNRLFKKKGEEEKKEMFRRK